MQNKPTCYVPQIRPEIYSGVPSFLGLPPITDKSRLSEYDFVVMGAPWEGVCTTGEHTGVELAPKTIRRCPLRYSGYLPDFDFDLFDHFSGADYGGAAVKNADAYWTFHSEASCFEDILQAGAIPIVFGGDHSLSYPLIQTFARQYDGNIGIIHFDAHLDNLDRYGTESNARCCPFHRVYEMKGFNPHNLVSIGIRGPRNHYSGMKTAREHGAHIITSFEVKQKGAEACIQQALQWAQDGTKALYITVCSDALDASENPAGPNDFCGLSTYELASMLYQCGRAGAGAFDYMEVYPPTDHNYQSSHAACWMSIYAMNGMAQGLLRQKNITK